MTIIRQLKYNMVKFHSLESAIEQMEVEVKENYEGALLKEEVTEEEVLTSLI